VFFQRLDDPLGFFIAGCCRSQEEKQRPPSQQQLPLPFSND
jgi:hypothetical protein